MRDKLNCPNCGAPITKTICDYCGTVFYDFTVLEEDKPSYILMNWYGRQIAFRAMMTGATIKWDKEIPPEAILEFAMCPDDEGIFLKEVEIGNTSDRALL